MFETIGWAALAVVCGAGVLAIAVLLTGSLFLLSIAMIRDIRDVLRGRL